MNPLKKKNVPWWIWLTVLGAIGLIVLPFVQSDERPVHVVGAGVIDLIEGSDAPEGIMYRLRTEASEPLTVTAKRFQRVLELRPKGVLLAFDAAQLTAADMSLATAQTIVQATVVTAEQSSSPVYMLGFVPATEANQAVVDAADTMNVWWTSQICTRKKIRCVELPPASENTATLRAALGTAIANALLTSPKVPKPTADEPRAER